MAHEHNMIDTDNRFIIDSVNKTITNPSGNKNTVVQYDHNSEVFTFQIPCCIEGHNMTECDLVQIHYVNTSSGTSVSTRSSNADIYTVTDIKVDPEDKNMAIFTWPLSQNGTQLAGTISFQVKFICYGDGTGIPSYIWQTKLFSAINVEAGINNTEIVVEENLDVILSFEERISALEESLKNNTGSGTVTNEQIANAVENYILENPVEGEKGEDGASAYEIALENGFEGSETEWLDSLKGEKGTDGKAGASVAIVEVNESTVDGGSNIITFSDGSTFTVKNGNKGSAGDTGLTGANGVDGYSPTATVTQTDTGAVITITDENGTTTASVTNGVDGKDGANGTNGKDGVSCTHSWNGTTLTVISASGTSSVNLKGDKGDTGAKGEQGIQGEKGADGSDYVLTDSDKSDIATAVKADLTQLEPLFANSIEECTDISKVYVLPDGYIYAYMATATEGTSTPNFTNLMNDPNSYIKEGYRYSQSGGAFSENSAVCGIVVPATVISGDNVLRVRGATKDNIYNYVYNSLDTGSNSTFGGSYSPLTWSTDDNGDIVGTFSTTSPRSTFITFTVNTGVNVDSLIVTFNEEITYTTTEGEIVYQWANTGHAFVPADYENRVIANEQAISHLQNETGVLESRLNSININSSGTTVFSTPAYAPTPQLPADGTADFHGLNITTQQAYDYMDALASKYKSYVTKQTMGKDQSGEFDHNRYILCKAYWRAWLKPNYPMMFAWINDNTVIYSVSASPRVGDIMYTTPYIGTEYGAATAVNYSTPDASNNIPGTPSTRTVNGLVFTRYKTGDVEPTIVYTKVEKSISAMNSGTVYNSAFGSQTNVTTYTKEAITCADGITYTRYPFEDLKADKTKPLSVFVLSNEHGHWGDNKVPSITLMRMAKDLCENRENPFLQWLKENAILTLIPVGNPWGYDPSAGDKGAGYNNSRGVNINRNYDTPGWAGSDNNYGDNTTFGEYPGSENETQHIMNTLHLCKAKVGLSMHGMGLGQSKKEPTEYTDGLMWQGCGYDKTRMTKVAEVLFSDYGQLIGGHTTWDQSYEYCGKSPAYIQYVGAVGGLNEIPDYETGTLDLYTSTVMEASYTQLLLFLQTWCEEALEKES